MALEKKVLELILKDINEMNPYSISADIAQQIGQSLPADVNEKYPDLKDILNQRIASILVKRVGEVNSNTKSWLNALLENK